LNLEICVKKIIEVWLAEYFEIIIMKNYAPFFWSHINTVKKKEFTVIKKIKEMLEVSSIREYFWNYFGEKFFYRMKII